MHDDDDDDDDDEHNDQDDEPLSTSNVDQCPDTKCIPTRPALAADKHYSSLLRIWRRDLVHWNHKTFRMPNLQVVATARLP